MLLGFAVGASLATAAAFIFAVRAQRFSYTGLFNLVVALGALGTYAGHVIGAAKYKDAVFKPLGLLPQGVFIVGAVIVLLGTIAVVGAILGVMTLIKGPPPH